MDATLKASKVWMLSCGGREQSTRSETASHSKNSKILLVVIIFGKLIGFLKEYFGIPERKKIPFTHLAPTPDTISTVPVHRRQPPARTRSASWPTRRLQARGIGATAPMFDQGTSSSASSAAAFVTPCGWLGIAAADAGVPAGSASAWGSIPRMCGEAWVAVGGGPALLWEPGAGRIKVDAERCTEGARKGEGQQSTPPYSGQWCTQYLRRPAIHAYVSRCARSCKGRMVDR